MPKLTKAVPKYRKHRASGQAVVSIGGVDHYLGPHGTKASRIEYDRLITEWLAGGRQPLVTQEDAPALTVSELIARYWRFAEGYYRKGGEPTSSLDGVRQALRPLRRLYGRNLAGEFGPRSLKAVRHSMVEAGTSRGIVNKRVGAIKRVFRWGVGEELVPPSVYQGLQAVAGLRSGRTKAPDHNPVEVIADATVDATLPELPSIVAGMVQFQRLTGCRPGEVCIVRPCDVDRTGEVWEYRPESHKTEHHGRGRLILVGPKAQVILMPYLLRATEDYCFSPKDAVEKQREERHEARVTPPNQGNVVGSNRNRKPACEPGKRYSRDSYRRAIHRAVELANRKREEEGAALLDKWSPNRLRHSAATEIRSRYGLEAAQVVLGHAQADVTQVYAERDLELARRVIREVG